MKNRKPKSRPVKLTDQQVIDAVKAGVQNLLRRRDDAQKSLEAVEKELQDLPE